jgi:hypothetical protein
MIPGTEPEPRAAHSASCPRPTILVVEDDPDIQARSCARSKAHMASSSSAHARRFVKVPDEDGAIKSWIASLCRSVGRAAGHHDEPIVDRADAFDVADDLGDAREVALVLDIAAHRNAIALHLDGDVLPVRPLSRSACITRACSAFSSSPIAR